MNLGINENILYKGKMYHIQTEDSGLKNPFIVTNIFIAGVIVANEKLSYADIVKSDCVDEVVKELLKDQHKKMVEKLKKGEFEKKKIEIIKDLEEGLDEVILNFLMEEENEEKTNCFEDK